MCDESHNYIHYTPVDLKLIPSSGIVTAESR
jgi:hypothetical protein